MLIVGIAGGTGSGKTTLAKALIEKLGPGNASLIPHDSYYKDQSHLPLEIRQRTNYDHPDAFETDLLIGHIKRLKSGEKIEMPTYDFSIHTRATSTITIYPTPVLIIEGILVLAEPELRSLFDIRVFVDTDADVRILRRMMRDMLERGRTTQSIHDQYLSTVKPMHDAFVEPSKRYADIIIPEGGHNEVAISLLFTRIADYVSKLEAAPSSVSGQ